MDLIRKHEDPLEFQYQLKRQQRKKNINLTGGKGKKREGSGARESGLAHSRYWKMKSLTGLTEKTKEQEDEEEMGHPSYEPHETMRMSTRMTNVKKGTTIQDKHKKREGQLHVDRGMRAALATKIADEKWLQKSKIPSHEPTPEDLERAKEHLKKSLSRRRAENEPLTIGGEHQRSLPEVRPPSERRGHSRPGDERAKSIIKAHEYYKKRREDASSQRSLFNGHRKD